MNDREIYQAAIDRWGIDAQAAMTMGECGELIAELTRRFVQGHDNLDALIDEIADVEIMLGQLRHIFTDAAVDNAKRKKLERLAGILSGDVFHPHIAK